MTNELTEYKGSSPVETAIRFLESKGNPEQLEKMMELQERWEANEARKAFHDAMTQAQKNMPVIPRDKKNEQTGSMYSKHETIIKLAKPVYTAAGFSMMFYEGDTAKPDHIRIMCDIRHEKGHMETRHIDLKIDTTGIKGTVNKTGIHGSGSTISYGRQYLPGMIFNIPTGDDNDGNQPPKKRVITPETKKWWSQAKVAYKRDMNFDNILKHAEISEENQELIKQEVGFEEAEKNGNV